MAEPRRLRAPRVRRIAFPRSPTLGSPLPVAVVIWHSADLASATALAHRLGEELGDGDCLVLRDVAGGALLDPAVECEGTVLYAGVAPEDADTILVIAADATPEPGLIAAMRKGAKEFEAWTGILLDPPGGAVAAAGLNLAFTGCFVPGRPGLSIARLPETHFLSAAVPGELFAVRRQTIDELGAFGPATTPAGVALDLSLRLRASGARAGVMPNARTRLSRWQPRAAGIEDRIPSVVRSYPGPILAVAGPALVLAGPAAVARGLVQRDGRDALVNYRAGLSAGRAAARERGSLGALRSLDSATFSDGLDSSGPHTSAPTRVLAAAWWGATTSAMRMRRARHRRQAARG